MNNRVSREEAVSFIVAGVKFSLERIADEFGQVIRRAAADVAATMHDELSPEIRKEFVTVLGNCAEEFEDLVRHMGKEFSVAHLKKVEEDELRKSRP